MNAASAQLMQLSPTAESAVRSTSKPDRGFGDLLRDLESDAGALGPSPSPSPDPTVERSAPRASSGGSQSAPTSAQGEKPATTSGQDVKQGKPAASGESGKPAAGDSQPAQSADKAQPVREAGQGGAGKTSGETGAQTNTKLTVKAGATAAGQAATATTTAASAEASKSAEAAGSATPPTQHRGEAKGATAAEQAATVKVVAPAADGADPSGGQGGGSSESDGRQGQTASTGRIAIPKEVSEEAATPKSFEVRESVSTAKPPSQATAGQEPAVEGTSSPQPTAPQPALSTAAEPTIDMRLAGAASTGQPGGGPSINASPGPAPVTAPTAVAGDAQIDAQGVVDRAIRGAQSLTTQQGGTVTMRLNPPELGQLRVQVSMEAGVVRANFETTSNLTADLLRREIQTLRQALETQGLTVDRLNVQPSQSGQSAHASAQQHQQDQTGGDGQSRGRFDQQQSGSGSQDGSAGQGRSQDQTDQQTWDFQRELLDLVA